MLLEIEEVNIEIFQRKGKEIFERGFFLSMEKIFLLKRKMRKEL